MTNILSYRPGDVADQHVICIVDDNPVVLAHIGGMLRRANLGNVAVFADPGQALAYCLADPPDVILLDYRMPRMDGLAFLRALDSCHTRPAVLMFSGFDLEPLRAPAYSAGAVDVLPKSVRGEEVVMKVRNLIACRTRRWSHCGDGRGAAERELLTSPKLS
ncbi:response regulator [Microbulbifer magnicolonia]|uniref:response regulator n=1 Tax=Microbulbifer magnicolonia TaxID=3109744 RepID=UPI002B407640|nr:response regulator [Microbulbifer sp. GG15]